MAVSREDVRYIAALARLRVPDARLDTLVGELNGILAHMQALQRVDGADALAGGEPAGNPMLLRPDVVGGVPLLPALADVAPVTRDGFLLVPRLGTHDDAAASAT